MCLQTGTLWTLGRQLYRYLMHAGIPAYTLCHRMLALPAMPAHLRRDVTGMDRPVYLWTSGDIFSTTSRAYHRHHPPPPTPGAATPTPRTAPPATTRRAPPLAPPWPGHCWCICVSCGPDPAAFHALAKRTSHLFMVAVHFGIACRAAIPVCAMAAHGGGENATSYGWHLPHQRYYTTLHLPCCRTRLPSPRTPVPAYLLLAGADRTFFWTCLAAASSR